MPRQKITRDMVLEAAFSIARSWGPEQVLVKHIAAALGCSVQPIYSYCENMDALREDLAGALYLYQGETVFSSAKLKMGRGNSGKLVSAVKSAMAEAAPPAELAVIDGSPGIGCPVISSISGVDLVLIVAEPSLSGLHDLKRIVQTASIFRAKTAVCVNKYDLSPEKTKEIEDYCQQEGIPFLGRIPYDSSASRAINEGIPLPEIDCPARDALYSVYCQAMSLLDIQP